MSGIPTPASQLPWRLSMSGYSVKSNDDDMPIICNNPWGVHMKEKDIPRWIENADYIVTACNAYPSLVAALKDFVTKWEQMEPAIANVCLISQVHGVPYSGPHLDDELEAIHRALQLAEGLIDPQRETP